MGIRALTRGYTIEEGSPLSSENLCEEDPWAKKLRPVALDAATEQTTGAAVAGGEDLGQDRDGYLLGHAGDIPYAQDRPERNSPRRNR